MPPFFCRSILANKPFRVLQHQVGKRALPNLLNINYNGKRNYSFSTPNAKIEKIGIVGLGLMGHGIAQVSAEAGYKVIGVENNQKALEVGESRITTSIDKIYSKAVSKGKMTQEDADASKGKSLSNLSFSTNIEDLADCDMIIEAIIENVEIKKEFYSKLGAIAKENCIFGSNTSSLSIDSFAHASGRADKMIGLHFFNPVQIMKLVEVVALPQTDPEVFEEAKTFVNSLAGKVAVSCKDTPGFIVNRLLVPYLAQGIALLDRGHGDIKDIDTSMELGAGHPMGPLTLADYVGLDTCLSILEGWKTNYPDEPAFIVPESLKAKVAAGKYGRKTGEGYWIWDGDKRKVPSSD